MATKPGLESLTYRNARTNAQDVFGVLNRLRWDEERQRRRNAASATEAMNVVKNLQADAEENEKRRQEYAAFMENARATETPAGPNALTPEMEARYQQANGVNRAPTAYQTYMMQVAKSQPAQEETRSTDELRRDMNRQNRIARGTERMTVDMAGQGLRDQSLLFNPTYTSNLRTMGQTMEAQQNKAAAATNLYQTLSVQRREQEEREKYSALMQNPDFAAKSQGDPAIGRKVSATSLSPAERLYQNIYNHGGEKTNAKDRNAAEFVSDEEAGIFFYLWNTQGPRAAQSYYNDYVDNRASQRRAEEAQRQAEAFGHYDVIGSSAESVVANFASGVGLVDMAWQNIARSIGLTDKNKPLNYYSSAQLPGLVSDAIRKGAADELAEMFPKLKIGKGENAVNVASFLYQTGMSMADSGVAVLLNTIGIPEAATLANMGAAAGTRAIRDARERGATDGQALAFGISSAIMEALFEKISLDRILEPSYAQTAKAHFLNALKQSFTEGSEEVMTTLANTAMDQLIMGGKSELFTRQRQLMEQGVSEKEALGAAFKQLGTEIVGDLLGGMISGFGMGGAKEAYSGIRTGVQNLAQDYQLARTINDAARQEQKTTPVEAAPQMQAPVNESQQNQNARQADPLGYAMNKAQGGETVTLNDARAIIENPQALQALRDTGVLTEEVQAGKEGRQQVKAAVEALAYNEARSALGISDSFANTQPVAQERKAATTPVQAAKEETRQAETAPTAPVPQRASESATESGLRITAAERQNTPPVPSRLTIGAANGTLNENRQEGNNNVTVQEKAQAASDSSRGDFATRARSAAAGRQGSNRSERASGVGRLLENLRTTQAIRGAKSRASQAGSLRTQAEAGNQREVSAKDLGIQNGTDAKTARLLTNDFAAQHLGKDWTRAVEAYAARGVKLQAMTGQLQKQTPDGVSNIRAYVSGDGKTITVQADHPALTWNQLLDHEELHRRIKEDASYKKEVEDALLADENLKPQLADIIDRYYEAYRAVDSSMTSEDIYEELLADYRAGFDMLDPLGLKAETRAATKAAAKDIKAVEQKGVKQTGENRHSQPTAYSEDGTKATVDDVAVASNIVDTITEDPRPFDYMSADKNSIETFPDWAQNFNKRGGENAQQIIDAVRQFTEAMITSDVIMGYVPVGSVAYNKTGPLRKNIEYVFSFDMDASCPRTFQFLNYRNELQRIAGRPLTYAESIQLIELMRAYGQQIPCSYCYVENKRVLLANNYLNWFGFYDRVVGAETDEEARKLMYGYNEKKDSLSKGAESELARWRKADKDYRPKASEVWLARQTAKNSVFNWLDQRNAAGLLSRKTGKNKIVEAVCKEFKVTDKAAKAEITDFVGAWIYDRDMKIPHNYEIVNDTDVSEVDQRALNMHRTAMAYANSASSARTVDNYMPYTDQIWNVTAEQKRRIMAQGGIRKHSSNDFRMDYVQDYFMFFADLAAGGWTGHTYTKNVDYVKIFGRTGDRINVSVAFTDENGQVRENMQEGMGWKDAQQLRKDYAENVGVMAMVTSDAQLSYALNSDWIDMIIPFHASGLDKSVWYNIRMWQDYTSKQNERWYTRGRMEAELKDAGVTVPKEASSQVVTELYRKTFNIKMITSKDGLPVKPHFLPGSYEVNGQTVPGHNNDKERYFQLCKEYGVVPRFQGILVDDGEGNMIDVTEHRNYMKLVKETARTDVEQKPIQFNFDQVDPALGMTPFAYAMQRMQEEARNGGYANTAEDKFGIVKEFQEEYLGKNIPLPTGLDENGKPLPGNLTDLLTDRAIAFREGLMEMQNQAAQEQAQVVEESQQEGKASIEIDPEVAAQFSPEAIARRQSNRTKGVKGERKVKRIRPNTFDAGGLYNQVEAQMPESQPENFEYDVIGERRSMNEARSRLKADFDGEVKKLREKGNWNGVDFDTGMGILYQFRQIGRATGDYSLFHEWEQIQSDHSHDSATVLQAHAKYSRTGTNTAMKGAADLRKQNQLTPAQQKQIRGHVERLMNGAKGDTQGAAGDAMKQAKGKKEPTKKQDGKVDKKKLDAETRRRKDAERIVREIYNLFERQQNHGEPVEDWLKLTGEELAKKIATRFNESTPRQKTTMQIILGDLVGFAEEHALPTKPKSETERRTAIDTITDYLNNRDAYNTAWAEAQDVLRAQYADDQEKLDALDGFLSATIAYNGEGTDRTMLDAILQSADVLGISEKRILELVSAGATNSTIDRIGNELVSQVKERMGADYDESFTQQLKDAVRRHVTGIALSESASEQALRLGRMETDAARKLDIDLQKILTESRLTKQDASRRVADYLIRELGIPSADAAIAAQRISESFMDELAGRADKRLQQMFGEKTTKAKEQRDKLLDLLRLGGFTNANVEDAVVDALGIGKLSREEQRRITGDMARFGETLDAIMDDDLEGLRQLIREQAAVRKTPLSRYTEKVLDGTVDAEYLKNFALAQLDAIAGDYAPRSIGSKVSTWQTLSHLLNLRTGNRNLSSNQVTDLVLSAANNVALLPDMLASAITGKRTVGLNKSWLSQAKRQGAKQGFGRSALEVRLDVSPDERQKSKYGTAGRRTWSMANSGTVGRILSHLEEAMGYELNTTDEMHKGSVRGETLESLARWVDQGYITQDEANDWAEEEALYRSFQDDTLIGNFLKILKNGLNTIGVGSTNGQKIGGKTVHDFGLGDIFVKYTQVPGALIHRSIEFSPLGYAKALYNFGQMMHQKKSGENTNKAQRDFALSIGRAVTGTGLLTLFYALTKLKLLRKGDDEKDKNAMAMHQAKGLGGTQLNLTGLGRWIEGKDTELQDGDVLVDLNYLEPMDALMTIAATLAEGDGINVKTVTNSTLGGLMDSVAGLSVIQTVGTIVDTIKYHDESNNEDMPLWKEIPLNIATSSLSGFIPSPIRQLAQATDTTYRDQYRSQNINDQIQARVANSIPGLRQTLAPKITPLGEDRKYQKPLLNYLNATLNPGNINVYQGSGVVDELNRVYGETDDAKIWPERNAPYSFTANDEKWTLTPDERTQYQRTRGQTTAKAMESVMGSDWYKTMSATSQAEVLNWIGNFSNFVAKKEMLESRGQEYGSTTYNKYYEAWQNGTPIEEVVADKYGKLVTAAAETAKAETIIAEAKIPDASKEEAETMSADAKRLYAAFLQGGVSDSTARNLATSMEGSEASGHEQWRMVYDAAGKEGEKAVTSVMTDDMKRNWNLAKDAGVSMDDYIKVREGFKDLNGNGNKSQDEWNATLDSFTFSTNAAKDKSIKGTLWQILTGSGSTKNNPYDKEAGQKVIDAKSGGGSGSGSYAPARIPALRIPEAPKVTKPGSGLRIRPVSEAAARTGGGLRLRK